MSDGFQFMDLIFLAMIAVFLVIRLRGVLGRRDGHETDNNSNYFRKTDDDQHDDDNVVQLNGHQSDENAQNSEMPEQEFEAYPEQLRAGLMQISKSDQSFTPESFIEGARGAFDMILQAYATGDRALLKSLLNKEVLDNFTGAIDDREKAGETVEDTLIGYKGTEIVEAYMEDEKSVVTVKFVSEQINVTRDENGDVVNGSPTKVIVVTDFWTFSRNTINNDPNWELVATGSLD